MNFGRKLEAASHTDERMGIQVFATCEKKRGLRILISR